MTSDVDAIAREDLLDALSEAHEGVQIIDRQWCYRFVNDRARSHLGRRTGDWLGRTVMECNPGIEQSELFEAMQRCIEDGNAASLETRFTQPDSTARSLSLRVIPCDTGIIVLSADVTEARRLQAEVHHLQKADAVARASGLVHDVNNLLTIVRNVAALLLKDSEVVARSGSLIQALESATERAAELVARLFSFARARDIHPPRPVDLNAHLGDAEPILRGVLGSDVRLDTRYSAASSTIRADSADIDQIIMNLTVNAKDAMPRGGRLTIETENLHLDASDLTLVGNLSPGEYVVLTFRDTGTGMDEDTQTRIFEPYFTTKEAGKGTGLGLSTVMAIVQRLGGHVRVQSIPLSGTTFELFLPLCRD
jgi:signal transduction histidine kinase